MDIQGWTYLIVTATFAVYIGIAVWSRARSTSGFYVAGQGVPAVANGMATGADWMSAASFLGMAGLISFMGYDGVILTGGEPTMSPMLKPALKHASSLGLHSRMITNGQLLADKTFFQECVDHGLTHIHVSLHSYRPEVHDYITAYPRAWETLVSCLSHVPDMGITADIN